MQPPDWLETALVWLWAAVNAAFAGVVFWHRFWKGGGGVRPAAGAEDGKERKGP